jgi:multiple sugar transport system ATP-binding protein
MILSDSASGLAARINVVEPTGSETHVLVDLAGTQINAVFRERIADTPGAMLHLLPDSGKVSLFDAVTRRRIDVLRK